MPIDQYKNLSSLKSQRDDVSSGLTSSKTAYAGMTDPTSADLYKQAKLIEINKKIDDERDAIITNRWSSQQENRPESSGSNGGVFGAALDTLLLPIRAVAGTAEYALGQNVKPGLLSNVAENITTGKRTFSDILKRGGANSGVAGTVGFMLDILLDPVNWATMGTAALIPRIAYGARKAGMAGAIAGAKSGLLQKATTAAKYTPNPVSMVKAIKGRSAAKAAMSEIAPAGEKAVSALPSFRKLYKAAQVDSRKGLVEKTFRSSLDYNKVVGRDIAELASQSWYRNNLKEIANSVVDEVPGGRDLFNAFDLANPRWMRLSKLKDEFTADLDSQGVRGQAILKRIEAGESIEDIYAEVAARVPSPITAFSDDAIKQVGDADLAIEEARALESALGSSDILGKIQNVGADLADASENVLKPHVMHNPIDAALQNVGNSMQVRGGLTLDDFKKAMDHGLIDETGVQWYDNTINKIKNTKKTIGLNGKSVTLNGEKILRGYSDFITGFKLAKVGGSPTAFFNSVVGNVAMAHMAGIKISPEFNSSVMSSWKVLNNYNDSAAILAEMFPPGSEMIDDMIRYPGTYRSIFGTSPQDLQRKYSVDRAIRKGRDAGIITPDISDVDAAKMFNQSVIDNMIDQVPMTETEKAMAARRLEETGETAGEVMSRDLKGKELPNLNDLILRTGRRGKSPGSREVPISLSAQELYGSELVNGVRLRLEDKVRAGTATVGDKLLNFVVNSMPNKYEKIDQSFRLGTYHYLTSKGLSEGELTVFKRFVALSPEDISAPVKGASGEPRMMISPEKALEASAKIYLNYAAMPAAVQVLRNLPILGSPFASFMYGMTLKTLETAAYNPAAFNKVALMMKDFGGIPTPLEKENRKSKYYSRLNEPGMQRIPPFFQEYPLYLNMSSALPWMTLNMFTPTERGYTETLPNALIKAIDRSPFVKDPLGTMFLDYFIIPLILRDSMPTGSFGQPIYPVDASFGEKAFYAGRALTESVVPGVASLGGLAVPTGDIPFTNTPLTELYPSYGGRTISYAKSGKNVYGKTGREAASSRLWRALLSNLGIKIQAPINLPYLPAETKAEIKKEAEN